MSTLNLIRALVAVAVLVVVLMWWDSREQAREADRQYWQYQQDLKAESRRIQAEVMRYHLTQLR